MKYDISIKLADLLDKKCVIPDLKSTTKSGVLHELSEQVASVYPSLESGKIYEILLERKNFAAPQWTKGLPFLMAR